MRSRIASETRGRPSFMRSPFHSEVRAATSSGEGAIVWAAARAGARSAAARATGKRGFIGVTS